MQNIWECVLGFMDSQIVLTAEDIGIFELLDQRPMHADEVAGRSGLPHDSAQRLLNALCALEITNKTQDNRYGNSEQTSNMLVKGKPGYIGDMFVHIRNELYPLWGQVKEALYAGFSQKDRLIPLQSRSYGTDSDSVRSFIKGMHAITYTTGCDFAHQAHELETLRAIVDIGGADGAFLGACLQKYHNLHGTVVDLPYIEEIAQEYFHSCQFGDRLSFMGADFFNDPLPPGADAYVLGFILHDWDDEAGSVLLSKIAAAAQTGSLLVIGEYLLDEDKTGPLHVVRADLNMLIAAQGRERSAQEYTDWIQRYGYRLQRIVMTRYIRAYMIARKQ